MPYGMTQDEYDAAISEIISTYNVSRSQLPNIGSPAQIRLAAQKLIDSRSRSYLSRKPIPPIEMERTRTPYMPFPPSQSASRIRDDSLRYSELYGQ